MGALNTASAGVGVVTGAGVGVALPLLAELLFEFGFFHTPHTSFFPLLTQINRSFGVSPKLPTLEQAPPSLGMAALA